MNLNSVDKFIEFANKINFNKENWNFEIFFKTLDQLGLMEYVDYNASIVRGLDYYTGLVFEIFDKHPENRRALCGGGSYAGLMNIFNEDPLPGVGFGLGDVTLKDFLKVHDLLPNFDKPKHDIYIASEDDNQELEVLSLSSLLRNESLNVCNNSAKLKFKKIILAAEKSGSPFAAILQSIEGKSIVKVKNLNTQEVNSFSINDIQQIKNFILGKLR